MESAVEYWTTKALLDWQVEMGADEAIGDAPVDRYALQAKAPAPAAQAAAQASPAADAPPTAPEADTVDPVQVARDAAAAASDLEGLKAAMFAFEHCDLKDSARNFIFADGVAGAKVMIVTDAPDRTDDRAGQILSGPAGVLFDKMIGAIGLSRVGEDAIYIAPVCPWNPPQNRDTTAAELAMMGPFLKRHIALADPSILVLMGNGPCQALLGRSGMTRLRGHWAKAVDRPALPMFAPAFLMANGTAKRDAWADLLALKSRLKDLS